MELEMRVLTNTEVQNVSGASTLSDNARIASNTCGTGNVKSVSETSFTCQ